MKRPPRIAVDTLVRGPLAVVTVAVVLGGSLTQVSAGGYPQTCDPCEIRLLDPLRFSNDCECADCAYDSWLDVRDMLSYLRPVAVPDSERYREDPDPTFGSAFDVRCLRIPDYPWKESEAVVGLYLVGRDEFSLTFAKIRDENPDGWLELVHRWGREPTISPPLSPVLWSRVTPRSEEARLDTGHPPFSPADLDSMATLVKASETAIPVDLAIVVCRAWLTWMATARQAFTARHLDVPDDIFIPDFVIHPTTYLVRGDHCSIDPLYARFEGPTDASPNAHFVALVDALISMSESPGSAALAVRVRDAADSLLAALGGGQ